MLEHNTPLHRFKKYTKMMSNSIFDFKVQYPKFQYLLSCWFAADRDLDGLTSDKMIIKAFISEEPADTVHSACNEIEYLLLQDNYINWHESIGESSNRWLENPSDTRKWLEELLRIFLKNMES